MQRRIVVSYRRFGTTYTSNLQVSNGLHTLLCLTLEIRNGRLPETSVVNYQSTLLESPEQRIAHFLSGFRISPLFMDPKLNRRVSNSFSSVHILSQKNPIHVTTMYIFLRVISIFPLHLRQCLPSSLFPSDFTPKPLYISLLFLASQLAPLVLFTILTIMEQEYKSGSSLLRSFPQYPCTYTLLITLLPNTLSPHCSSSVTANHTQQTKSCVWFLDNADSKEKDSELNLRPSNLHCSFRP